MGGWLDLMSTRGCCTFYRCANGPRAIFLGWVHYDGKVVQVFLVAGEEDAPYRAL